jgi:hypothetical protein
MLEPHRAASTALIDTMERVGSRPLGELPAQGDWQQLDLRRDASFIYYHEGLARMEARSSEEEQTTHIYSRPFAMDSIVHFVRTAEIDEMWFNDNRPLVEATVRRFATAPTFIVIRTVEHVPAVPHTARGSFTPGRFRGEAHFFDRNGRDLGGFPFTATNSSTIEYRFDAAKSLERNLRDCAWMRLAQELVRAFPNGNFVVPQGICS